MIIMKYYHDSRILDLFLRRHLLDKEELVVVPHLNIGMDRWPAGIIIIMIMIIIIICLRGAVRSLSAEKLGNLYQPGGGSTLYQLFGKFSKH